MLAFGPRYTFYGVVCAVSQTYTTLEVLVIPFQGRQQAYRPAAYKLGKYSLGRVAPYRGSQYLSRGLQTGSAQIPHCACSNLAFKGYDEQQQYIGLRSAVFA